MSTKHIHTQDKMELARLILACAPVSARGFTFKKLLPEGYLVTYSNKVEGSLSLAKLAKDLGVPPDRLPKEKPGMNMAKQGEIYHRWRKGDVGLITGGVMDGREKPYVTGTGGVIS